MICDNCMMCSYGIRDRSVTRHEVGVAASHAGDTWAIMIYHIKYDNPLTLGLSFCAASLGNDDIITGKVHEQLSVFCLVLSRYTLWSKTRPVYLKIATNLKLLNSWS